MVAAFALNPAQTAAGGGAAGGRVGEKILRLPSDSILCRNQSLCWFFLPEQDIRLLDCSQRRRFMHIEIAMVHKHTVIDLLRHWHPPKSLEDIQLVAGPVTGFQIVCA